EKRADGWRARYGVEQTEIDALATLRPDILNAIVENAVAPYFDETLRVRTIEALDEYEEEANEQLESLLESPDIAPLVEAAESARLGYKFAIGRLKQAMAHVAIDLDEPEMPEAELPEPPGDDALVSSDMDLLEHV